MSGPGYAIRRGLSSGRVNPSSRLAVGYSCSWIQLALIREEGITLHAASFVKSESSWRLR